jgi:hypothetical protein
MDARYSNSERKTSPHAGTVPVRGLPSPLRRTCLCAFALERLRVEPGKRKEAFAAVPSSWPVLSGMPTQACAHDYGQRKNGFRSPGFSPRLTASLSLSKRFRPGIHEGNFPEHAPSERVSKVRPRALNSPAPGVPTPDRMGMRRGTLAGDGGRVLRKVSLPPFWISQLGGARAARGGKTAILSGMEFAFALAVTLNEAGRTAFTDADFRSRVDLSIPTVAVDRNETKRNPCPSFVRSLFRSPRLDRWQGGKDARDFSLPAREGAGKAARFLRGLSERKP